MNLKIKWIPMIIEKWYEILPCDTFWILKGTDSNGTIMGYFQGFDELDDQSIDSFLTNINCYYLHGTPCDDDNCDCKIAYNNDSLYLQSMNIYNNNQIENMIHVRAPLLKQLKN